jgi:predicted component of type VI protein secretion system
VLDKPSLRTNVLPKTDPLLDGLGDDDNAVVHAGEIAPGEVMLVVRQGPEIGTRFSLEGDQVTVGRVPGNDIQLDDVTVSRQHAVLVRQGAAWLVRDLGSLNGTYVNSERVDESVVQHGDEVQIGRFRLVAFFG